MPHRWLLVIAILAGVLFAGCRLAPPTLTATIAHTTTSTGGSGGVVTIEGSGFGAHDSLSVGLVDVPDRQGSNATHQYAGPWPETADKNGTFTMRIGYECAPSADISGLTIRIFDNDTSNQTSSSVTKAAGIFCDSTTEVPVNFAVAS
jgi:hypothetical protein